MWQQGNRRMEREWTNKRVCRIPRERERGRSPAGRKKCCIERAERCQANTNGNNTTCAFCKDAMSPSLVKYKRHFLSKLRSNKSFTEIFQFSPEKCVRVLNYTDARWLLCVEHDGDSLIPSCKSSSFIVYVVWVDALHTSNWPCVCAWKEINLVRESPFPIPKLRYLHKCTLNILESCLTPGLPPRATNKQPREVKER